MYHGGDCMPKGLRRGGECGPGCRQASMNAFGGPAIVHGTATVGGVKS